VVNISTLDDGVADNRVKVVDGHVLLEVIINESAEINVVFNTFACKPFCINAVVVVGIPVVDDIVDAVNAFVVLEVGPNDILGVDRSVVLVYVGAVVDVNASILLIRLYTNSNVCRDSKTYCDLN